MRVCAHPKTLNIILFVHIEKSVVLRPLSTQKHLHPFITPHKWFFFELHTSRLCDNNVYVKQVRIVSRVCQLSTAAKNTRLRSTVFLFVLKKRRGEIKPAITAIVTPFQKLMFSVDGRSSSCLL